MNYIGEKIKELRRKNDMTQEKLADLLSVSYQTISKWECGVSNPDVYSIAPLARLFGVSTDELLGLASGDANRAKYDAAYENYWQKDHTEMYQIAQNAVFEFPGDMKYLEWLANIEYLIAFDDNYRSNKSDQFFTEIMEKSVRHHRTVIETTMDDSLKEKAVTGIVMSLKLLNRTDEAKKFAKLIPEKPRATRNEILSYCLTGTELFDLNRKRMYQSLQNTLAILQDLGNHSPAGNPYTKAVLDAEEAMIKAVVTDENYLGFWYYLYWLYIRRSECAILAGEYDHAVNDLETAKKYAQKSDSLYNTGKHCYTCPLLCGFEDEWNVEEAALHDGMDHWNFRVSRPIFDPVRDRNDFKALIQ